LVALPYWFILVSCSGPKQLYYFDRQPLVRKPDVVDYSQTSHPRSPDLLTSAVALAAGQADEVQPTEAIPLGEPKVTVLTSEIKAVPKVEVVDDVQAPDQKPGKKKYGWIGTTSLLLILVGLPLIFNASWVAAGAGMLLAGLVLAIIAKTRKPEGTSIGKSDGRDGTDKPRVKRGTNEGAATVGLVILVVAAVAVLVLSVMAAIFFDQWW
jgi:hypothetical protein